MEHLGQELCHEHGKVIHQIEHINWHLSHAHPHEITTPIELPHIPPKICHTDGILSGHGHGHIHGRLHCTNKPSTNMVMHEKKTIFIVQFMFRILTRGLNCRIPIQAIAAVFWLPNLLAWKSKYCEIPNTLHINRFFLFICTIKGYLQISAERMIKAISELRHKICQARQNLEHETEVNLRFFSLQCNHESVHT